MSFTATTKGNTLRCPHCRANVRVDYHDAAWMGGPSIELVHGHLREHQSAPGKGLDQALLRSLARIGQRCASEVRKPTPRTCTRRLLLPA